MTSPQHTEVLGWNPSSLGLPSPGWRYYACPAKAALPALALPISSTLCSCHFLTASATDCQKTIRATALALMTFNCSCYPPSVSVGGSSTMAKPSSLESGPNPEESGLWVVTSQCLWVLSMQPHPLYLPTQLASLRSLAQHFPTFLIYVSWFWSPQSPALNPVPLPCPQDT